MSRRLRAEIEAEISNLARVATDMARLVDEIEGDEATTIEVAASAAFMHAFYNGVENALKRIGVAFGSGVPAGQDWHAALLEAAASAAPGRPGVLTREMADTLKPYLQFRHMFRHAYTFDLNWAKMRPLVLGLSQVAADVGRELTMFAAALDPARP